MKQLCVKWMLRLSLLLSALPALAAHYGVAPIDPLDPDDVVFVVDRGGALDTGCRYRSLSPILFSIVVDRYVGPTNSDGTLKDVEKLVATRVISPKAHLILPAADVDDLAQPAERTTFRCRSRSSRENASARPREPDSACPVAHASG